MDDRKLLLESLAAVLLREEPVLCELLSLADQMRDALISSDFGRLADAGQRMSDVGDILDELENDREGIIDAIGLPAASLDEAVALATELGVPALGACRSRLAGVAQNLQQAQERNAQLILGAARMRERWFNILAGLASPTYGAGGRQNIETGRRFVSKSA